ncbi:hypothetical protein ES703_103560 [subsurface metagenome]
MILGIVMTVMTIVAGTRWAHFKNLLKELAEAMTAVSDAVEDDDITKPEMKKMTKEWGEVIAAAKKLIGR